MSVVSYAEIWSARTAGVDENGNRKLTRVFRVLTDDPEDSGAIAILGVPINRYDSHPDDAGAIARTVDASSGETPTVWIVTYNYDSGQIIGSSVGGGPAAGPGEGPSPGGSPIGPSGGGEGSTIDDAQDSSTPADERPWTIEFSSIKSEKLLEQDRSDPPLDVVNTAGQPFSPPITTKSNTPQIRISGFVRTFDFEKIETYTDAVNASEFLGFAAGHVRCTDYSVSATIDNKEFFWGFTLTFEVNRDGHNNLKILNAGTVAHYADGAGVVIRAITDDQGQAVSAPVPLSEAGTVLAAGAEPNYLTFKPYYAEDFDDII